MTARRVVIIGGGFGGVRLARRLERAAPADTEVVLISSENHFVFTPLLPETAGRAISPLHVVVPGREMVRRTQWLTANVTRIDRESETVHYTSRGGECGQVKYDHLVLACGAVADFSGVPGLAEYAYPLRTLGDAIFLSNDLMGRLEEASLKASQDDKQRLLSVVVIGGGFSGVEIAGALKDLMDRTRRYYPQLGAVLPRIILLQSGERILPELGSVSLSRYGLKRLRAQGIDVRLNSKAIAINEREAITESGERIPAATIVCTVGSGCNPILRTLGIPLDRGRLKTQPDMRVPACHNVWALGDNALVPNAKTGEFSPATAQFAVRQAEHLAHNLAAALASRQGRPFSFRPLGMMASIGHRRAVAEIVGLRLSGFLAWLLWRAIYLAKMPTLHRKIEVAVDWARSIVFPTSVVHLQLTRTPQFRAHEEREAI
jgi:NADH:quinone reductase (non-electrogenic)